MKREPWIIYQEGCRSPEPKQNVNRGVDAGHDGGATYFPPQKIFVVITRVERLQRGEEEASGRENKSDLEKPLDQWWWVV